MINIVLYRTRPAGTATNSEWQPCWKGGTTPMTTSPTLKLLTLTPLAMISPQKSRPKVNGNSTGLCRDICCAWRMVPNSTWPKPSKNRETAKIQYTCCWATLFPSLTGHEHIEWIDRRSFNAHQHFIVCHHGWRPSVASQYQIVNSVVWVSLPSNHFRWPSSLSWSRSRLVIGRRYVNSHVVGCGAVAGGKCAASNCPSHERVPRRRNWKWSKD